MSEKSIVLSSNQQEVWAEYTNSLTHAQILKFQSPVN